MDIHVCISVCVCVYKSRLAHNTSLSISALFCLCITQQVTYVFGENCPPCDLMLILPFVIQTQLAFSTLRPLWYLTTHKEAKIVYSILKRGTDEENISMDRLLAAFTTSVFLKMESPSRYLHLTSSAKGSKTFGIKDRKVRLSNWIATHFLQQSKMHFTWTLNSEGRIWFPVKTWKWWCVPVQEDWAAAMSPKVWLEQSMDPSSMEWLGSLCSRKLCLIR